MSDLGHMQHAFAEALIGDSPHAAMHWVENEDGLARERLFVYRRNAFSSLIECLAGRYSRVRRILGPGEFDALARNYVISHPPTDAALLHYGSGFPEFLRAAATQEGMLPWLADLALLEAYWHESYHERDALVLDAAAVSEVPPQKLSHIAFEPHPTLRSLSSNFDLLRLWQEPLGQALRLDCEILVIRRDMKPEVYRLESGFADFFRSLSQGETTACAFELAKDAGEFSGWLARLVAWGVFSSFRFVQE